MNATETTYTIKQLIEVSGLSNVYIRRAISTGKLEATKERVGDTKVFRNVVTESAYNAWRATTASRSRREDGRNKYTLYATAEEFAQIEELLAKAKNEAIVARANAAKVAVS